MTEKDFYTRQLRPALHQPPMAVVFRVEDYGLPDVLVVLEGITYWLELKTLEHMPVREGTPFRVKYTTEQKRTLSMVNRTSEHYRGFFLVGVAREGLWFLFPPDIPDEMDDPYEYALSHGTMDELPRLLT